MIHSKIEFDKDVELLKEFNKYVDLKDLHAKLKLVSPKSNQQDIKALKDRLEGIMHSEGAGSIIFNNISLPQLSQKLLIHLKHFKELK